MVSLYFSDEQSENKRKKAVPVTAEGVKYSGINLTKEIRDLHIENYETLLKEIREDLTK